MWCACDGLRPQMRQAWLATKLRCSLERWRLGSPIGRALLSIPFCETLGIDPWVRASTLLVASALSVLGFTRAVAQLFKWLTRSFARSAFTFPIGLSARLRVRTIATFRSQTPNRSSIVEAADIALLSVLQKSSGRPKVPMVVPASER